MAEKKIYSIRGSQLRRVAQKPIRIRVPAMMDCRSYGKLSVKHNIDPRFLCPTPANSGFTLVAAVPPGGAFCNVGLPTHCHTNLSQPPVSILFPLSFRFRPNLRPFREQPIFSFISSFVCLRMHLSAMFVKLLQYSNFPEKLKIISRAHMYKYTFTVTPSI